MSHGSTRIVLLATVTLFAPQAGAQTSDPADAPPLEETAGAEIGDIVVTARRREESLQDVPVSVAAFSSDTLIQRNVSRLDEITQIVPGLTSQAQQQGNAALTFSVRGQRQAFTTIAYESPVAVYQDEIIQSRPQGLKHAFFDIANVQVLKGPQGTLFGRNATGGAVLVTSQKPTDHFGGYVTVDAGTYGLFSGQGAINLPLSPVFQVRLAGSAITRNGWTDNPFMKRKVDDEHAQAWRVSLRTVLGDGAFENNLIFSGGHQRQDATVYKIIAFVPPASLPPASVSGVNSDLAFLNTQPFRTTTSNVPDDGIHNHVIGIANTTSVEAGDITFRNIFGYRRVRNHQYYDLSGQSTLLADSQQDFTDRQYSNEFQVLGTILDKSLDFVAGLYYFHESGSEIQFTRIFVPVSPNNTFNDYSMVSESYAAYGQATYRPTFINNLSLTAGLRYTKDKRDFEQRARFVSGVCRILNADVGGVPLSPCVRSADAEFSRPTYTLSVDWKFDGKNMVYVTHRDGYQSGGFTYSALRPSEFTPYRPQTVKDYEVGLKTEWTIGSVAGRTNLAAYRGNYKDIQRVLAFTSVNPAGFPFAQQRILNAATAVVQGIEFDTRFDFNGILAIDLSYAYTDARYKDFVVSGVDYSKSKFSGTPAHTLSAAARLRLPISEDIARAHIQLSSSYQSSSVTQDVTAFDPARGITRAEGTLPGFTLLNSRLDLDDIAGLPTRVSFWARNLLNKRYYIGGSDGTTNTGNTTRILGDPRTVGIQVNYRF